MSYLRWIRGQVGSQKIILVTATAVIRDNNGRFLLQQRGDFGWWGFSGGVLELGESLPACAVREAREETGLEVVVTRLIGLYSSPDFDVLYPNGDQVQQFTATFECHVTGGDLRLDGDETTGLAWCEPGELLERLGETAVWYRAMAEDCLANQPEVSFQRGQPGNSRAEEPYFRFVRRYVGQDRFICPAAAALIVDNNGHVLLQRRGDDGSWALPGGGMELGERIDQTVIHEIFEETGLAVEPVQVVGVYSDERFEVAYPNGDLMKYVSTLFLCRVVGGTLCADGEESLELRYFAPDDLPPLPPRHRERIEDGLRGGKTAVF